MSMILTITSDPGLRVSLNPPKTHNAARTSFDFIISMRTLHDMVLLESKYCIRYGTSAKARCST